MVAIGRNNQKTLMLKLLAKEMTVNILGIVFRVESNQEENYLLNAILFGFIPILQVLYINETTSACITQRTAIKSL